MSDPHFLMMTDNIVHFILNLFYVVASYIQLVTVVAAMSLLQSMQLMYS